MNKRKKLIESTVLLPSYYARDGDTCACGYDMNGCLAKHCQQPARSYTLAEVTAMEAKLKALSSLHGVTAPPDEDEQFQAGYVEGAFHVLERVREILAGEVDNDNEAM